MDQATAIKLLEEKVDDYGYKRLSLEACEALREAYERGELYYPLNVAWRVFSAGMQALFAPVDSH